MASRLEIVVEEYIEEWKDKSENENTTNSTEWWKRCPRPTTVAVLGIQKFSNCALHVINK